MQRLGAYPHLLLGALVIAEFGKAHWQVLLGVGKAFGPLFNAQHHFLGCAFAGITLVVPQVGQQVVAIVVGVFHDGE